MRVVDIIRKKRDGGQLTSEEINWLITGYCAGEVADYQMSALLMAIYYEGMTAEETAALTLAMANSGDRIDLSDLSGIKVDKHSTGGVGDKTTLILAPLVAAAGVPVAKMSGRGLGHTGGTIDKLEAIAGYRTEMTRNQFIDQVKQIGAAVVGQSGNLAPADKLLYALRDVTATVESIPLIASSIMSKKLAAGANAIVLDVKVGSGAFMKTLEAANSLAEAMVAIGGQAGLRTTAIISNMDQPLGYAIGNALEVAEAIAVLRGEGPSDLTELSLELAAHMLVLGEKAPDVQVAHELLRELISSGKALEKLCEMVTAQGGDADLILHPERLPAAPLTIPVLAVEDGYVERIEAEGIGMAAMLLGAGRAVKQDKIDYSVGVVLHAKVGDKVQLGDVLATLYVREENERMVEAKSHVLAAYELSQQSVEPAPLVLAIVEA